MNKIYVEGYKDGKDDCKKEFRELVQGRIDELSNDLEELYDLFPDEVINQRRFAHDERIDELTSILASLDGEGLDELEDCEERSEYPPPFGGWYCMKKKTAMTNLECIKCNKALLSPETEEKEDG